MTGLAADPTFDSDMRRAAYGIVDRILRSIDGSQRAASTFVDQVAAVGYAEYVLTMKARAEGEESLRRLGVPANIQFTVVFDEYISGAYAAFASRLPSDTPAGESKEAIVLYTLPPLAQIMAQISPQELLDSVLENLHHNPDVLVHEVIHMLDHYRGMSFASMSHRGASPATRPGSSPRDYVSNPQEFNAFFQQGMFQLRAHLENMSLEERQSVMRTFENFKKESNAMWALHQLRHDARPKWIRKMDVRLYQHWEMWKKAYDASYKAEAFVERRKKRSR